MSTMFNNLFPSLNLNTVKHSTMKRVVLINYDSKKDIVEFRHYYIKQNYTDMNNKIKKILNTGKLPNLKDCKDLSEYFTDKVGFVSESDIDMLPNSKIEIDAENKNGKIEKKKINLRLFEIGPRITMKLVKIEEGFLGGSVFYHRYKQKTQKELREQKSMIETKIKSKEERKQIQEENVRKKQEIAAAIEEKLNKKSKRNVEYDMLNKRNEKDLETFAGEEQIEGDEIVEEGEEEDGSKNEEEEYDDNLEGEEYEVEEEGGHEDFDEAEDDNNSVDVEDEDDYETDFV